ncbi:MAG: hypothetical protein JWP97_5881 [Labilithrix sp.]|nr:hypothetical protein [Labilithrix sp.]
MRKLLATVTFLGAAALAADANAFCGFYVSGADGKLFNDATQVVLMREGTRTVLSMQNSYAGPPKDFAMVVPVPVVLQQENVKTLPKDIFARVDQMTAPRLVEYWEQDPCAPPMPMEAMALGGAGPRYRSAPAPKAAADLGVTVEAKFTVGEYQIVILSAQDAAGLDTWLRQEQYKIPEGADAYLRPYVQAGSKFFVAKVDVTKVKFENGRAALSPLRFHYDADTFSLPVRLGLMNSQGTQDLIVNVLAKGTRYEVANYPNVTIPTNFDVAEAARGQFGTFYAALFDRTLQQVPKAVVTEYSWDATTCDPCPAPPLTAGDLATLGADVLPSSGVSGGQGPGAASGPPGARPPRRPWGGGSGFVMTRLHARYGKESLGEDLVFRTASPIAGGREVSTGAGGLEHGAQPSGINNFQGRYAIRHPWTGPVACKSPVRGIWGGPPGGAQQKPAAATGLAFAPRGKLQLAAFVKGPLPDAIALPGAPTPLGSPVVPGGGAGATNDAGGASAASDAGPELDASSADGGSGVPPATPPASHGCGCTVAPDVTSTGALVAGALAFGAALLRRKRRR